jgi:hypothetical protein
LHLFQDFESSFTVVLASLNEVRTVDKGIADKANNFGRKTCLEEGPKSFLTHDVQQWRAYNCPNQRACSVALVDALHWNDPKVTGIRILRVAICRPDGMLKVLQGGEHTNDFRLGDSLALEIEEGYRMDYAIITTLHILRE